MAEMASAFVLMNIASTLVLTIYGGSGIGDPVIMDTNEFGSNQLFVFDNGTIKSTLNELVLDVNEPQTMGCQVVMAAVNGQSSQQWSLDADGFVRNGVSSVGNELVMSAAYNDPEPEVPVIVAVPYTGQPGELFQIVYPS